MVYPTGTPVKERVIAHIVTTLEAIGSPGFNTEVVAVKRLTADNPEVEIPTQEFPAIILSFADITRSDSVNGMIACDLGQTARLCLVDRDNYNTELELFIADVSKALTDDYTRGGIAVDTKVIAEQATQFNESTGLAYADVSFRVRFRHLYSDPNTAI